ncbi:hypothetical protein AX14_010206, partial [Amanita brunnescens Koide BX004]
MSWPLRTMLASRGRSLGWCTSSTRRETIQICHRPKGRTKLFLGMWGCSSCPSFAIRPSLSTWPSLRGEARIEKLLYAFTLPFLRRAAILCRSVLPAAFPTPSTRSGTSIEQTEYRRLLDMLGIPPLSYLPNQDTLQNAPTGWCAHYGHSQVMSQLNCGVTLEYPRIYRLPSCPWRSTTCLRCRIVNKALMCQQCRTVPSDAAICLICGTMCCMQSICCQDADNDKEKCDNNMHMR